MRKLKLLLAATMVVGFLIPTAAAQATLPKGVGVHLKNVVWKNISGTDMQVAFTLQANNNGDKAVDLCGSLLVNVKTVTKYGPISFHLDNVKGTYKVKELFTPIAGQLSDQHILRKQDWHIC